MLREEEGALDSGNADPLAALPACGCETAKPKRLAGGVDAGGRPHEAVLRRLRRAAKLYAASRERGHTLAVVANGGGTTHKPKWVSPAGYAVPEAALMARELERVGVAALSRHQPDMAGQRGPRG